LPSDEPGPLQVGFVVFLFVLFVWALISSGEATSGTSGWFQPPPPPPQPLQRKRGIERLPEDEIAARLALKYGAPSTSTPVNITAQGTPMLQRLAIYYDSKGIAATNFRCSHRHECAADSPRFTTAQESYVGPEYEKGNGPRLLFLSLDSGSAEGNPQVKTLEAVRQREMNCDVDGLPKNKHWYLTHELAWVLLRPFHPQLTIADTSPYFAHVNSAKCCQNNPQRGKASGVLFKNCRSFIPGELRILKPDIIVTQGGEARDVIVKECKVVRHDRKEIEGATYETGVVQLTPDKQALWISTYHPNNYGKFHPQRKNCWRLYAEAVKLSSAASECDVAFPFDPSPTTLWTLTNCEKLATCEVAFVPIGVQARVLRNGELLYSRIFTSGDEAVAWVEEERQGHLAKGWTIAGRVRM
jgi:uracil DNA glycosylase superfamily protein